MGDLGAVVKGLSTLNDMCLCVGDLALSVLAVVLNVENEFDVLEGK